MGSLCTSNAEPVSSLSIDDSSWLKNSLGDLEKLSEDISGSTYRRLQTRYTERWKEKMKYLRGNHPKLHKKTKFSIREGVPNFLCRKVILKLLKVSPSHEYFQLIKQVPVSMKFIPTFSEYRLEELIEKDYLVAEGQETLSRLLWTLNQFNSVDYCPQIVPISSLLLVYLSEQETYAVVSKLLRTSVQHDSFIRWHLSIDYQNHMKLISAMADYIMSVVPHIEIPREEFIQVIDNMARKFFVGYFKAHCLLRILLCYISEGSKVIFRLIFVICFRFQKILSHKSKEEYERFLIEHCNDLDDIDGLLKFAFKARITHKNNRFMLQDVKVGRSYRIYFPDISKLHSSIVSTEDIIWLWTHISPTSQLRVPAVVYSTAKHGISLRSLLSECSELERDTPCLLVMKTDDHRVIGAFTSCSFQVQLSYFGDSSCFLFLLAPDYQFYAASGLNDMYVFVNHDRIIFGGGGRGPGLMIGDQLLKGSCYQDETYKITDTEEFFNIIDLEVIALLAS